MPVLERTTRLWIEAKAAAGEPPRKSGEITVVNTLFGSSVTTAGLLPGTALQTALAGRRDLDLALLPGECLNDDGLFMDSMSLALLAAAVPMELRLSKDFVDALHQPVAA
jgi:NifB/MoaA-like Fe-S oxidoreductase